MAEKKKVLIFFSSIETQHGHLLCKGMIEFAFYVSDKCLPSATVSNWLDMRVVLER
jgi:hypothetical protein